MIIICWIVSLVALSYRRYKDIIPVIWKAPTCQWVKVNAYGSLVVNSASCGESFGIILTLSWAVSLAVWGMCRFLKLKLHV